MKSIPITLLFLAIVSSCNAQYQRHVKSEESFTIKLSASMGTGYSWQLADSSFSEQVVFEKEDSENQPDSSPGSSGTQVFHFKAIKPGATLIRFIYVRPFQKPFPKNSPRKTYKIVIS